MEESLSVKEKEILSHVRENPYYIMAVDKPSKDLFMNALGYKHKFEDDKLLKKTYFLRSNLSELADEKLYVELQRDIVKNHKDDLFFVPFNDIEACKTAVRDDMNLLRNMRLTPKVADELYEWNHETISHLPFLSEACQYKAVKDDWLNIYRMKLPERGAYTSFVQNTLGVKNMQPPYSDKVISEASELLNSWKIFKELTSEMTTEKELFGGARDNLYEHGIASISEQMRGDIDSQLFKYSLIKFRKETGCEVGNEIVEAFKAETPSDLKRLICIKEGISESVDTPILSFNTICLEASEAEIARLEKASGKDGLFTPTLQFELIQELKVDSGKREEGCTKMLNAMNLTPKQVDLDSIKTDLSGLLSEWQFAECNFSADNLDFKLDMDYIKSLGYSDFEQEFRKNVYRYFYEASLVDFTETTELIIDPDSKIFKGEGFYSDAYRNMGLRGAVKSPVTTAEGGMLEIYEAARETTLKSIMKGGELDPRIVSTAELRTLRSALKKVDKFLEIEDLSVDQIAALYSGRTVNIGGSGMVFRQKSVTGYTFRGERTSMRSLQKEKGSGLEC